jgi:hypothetical protein
MKQVFLWRGEGADENGTGRETTSALHRGNEAGMEDSIPTPSHTQHTRFIARSCSLAPVIFIDKTGLPATEHSVIFTY